MHLKGDEFRDETKKAKINEVEHCSLLKICA